MPYSHSPLSHRTVQMAVNESSVFKRALLHGYLFEKVQNGTDQQEPIISVKEARKILGILSKDLTNEDIIHLINCLEQMAQINVQDIMVRKMIK